MSDHKPITMHRVTMLIASAIGLVFSVGWVVKTDHESKPHKQAVTVERFQDYEKLQAEMRSELRAADARQQILANKILEKVDQIAEDVTTIKIDNLRRSAPMIGPHQPKQ